MEKLKKIFRVYWKILVTFLIIMILVWLGFLLHVDKKVIAFTVIIFGFITQLFTEILALVALIPFLGPFIVKIISLPFILIVNGLAYIVTFFAFKKGYKIEVARSKMFTTAVLIGIIIGFILGKLL